MTTFSLWETTQTLFWAAFGLIDLDNFELAGIKEFTRYSSSCLLLIEPVIITIINIMIDLDNFELAGIKEFTRYSLLILIELGLTLLLVLTSSQEAESTLN